MKNRILRLWCGVLIGGCAAIGQAPPRLREPPLSAVNLTSGFWADRLKTTREVVLPNQLRELELAGFVDNFRRLSGSSGAPRKGARFSDGFVYRLIEAAAHSLILEPDPKLRKQLDGIVDAVVRAQDSDGYLNTYFQGPLAERRYTEERRSHELLCTGQLIEAGLAYYEATGDRKLLDAGTSAARHFMSRFGPNKAPILDGHPGLGMALADLFRLTPDGDFLEFSRYLLMAEGLPAYPFLKEWGYVAGWRDSELRYMFSEMPFTKRHELSGNGFRAMYGSASAAAYALESGDGTVLSSLDELWTDLTTRRLYITGTPNVRMPDQLLGAPFELPNDGAMDVEAGHAAGLIEWARRMLQLAPRAEYADAVEDALYNSVAGTFSLNGSQYLRRNPLEAKTGRARVPWSEATGAALAALNMLQIVPRLMYGVVANSVYVHLYGGSKFVWDSGPGEATTITQHTDYPWRGDVLLTVSPASPKEFSLCLRVPKWSPSFQVSINHIKVETALPGDGYLRIRRRWSSGDEVLLRLDVSPATVFTDPRVTADFGRTAVRRGALIYCIESVDQADPASLTSLRLRPVRGRSAVFKESSITIAGVPLIALLHDGVVQVGESSGGPLYGPGQPSRARPAVLKLIPYFAWANRGAAAMRVWIPILSGRT